MITEEKCSSFKDFVDKIEKAGTIRLVKLKDQGFTAPATRDGIVVIQPMVRIVATAFDRKQSKIIRWEVTADARNGVSIDATTGQGTHDETTMKADKERIRQTLQLDGYSVENGEWTVPTVEILLKQMGG